MALLTFSCGLKFDIRFLYNHIKTSTNSMKKHCRYSTEQVNGLKEKSLSNSDSSLLKSRRSASPSTIQNKHALL